MTIEEIHELNGKFSKFGYFVTGENAYGINVTFVDDKGELRTETATRDQLEAAYPVLQKEYDENCAALELEPTAINIKNVEAKLLDAGRNALDKLLGEADDDSTEADAAKAKFLRMVQASDDIFPREIAKDLSTEIFCRLRLSYGSIAAEWLTV